ncbi:MAG TPA: hypothetical protein VKH46_06440 [Thermoanaerobaculia bacterium]|jgi:hypothetical protein|nr:hypothetical protein [Thermoanaerobaculia bacterium]
MPRRIIAVLLLAGAARAAAPPPKDELVFVAGTARPPAAISSSDLRRIYLGRTTRWPDGRRIVLAVRPAATAAGRIFYDRVAGMSEIDFSRLWLGVLFRGDAETAPRVIRDAADVRRFLARTPDGLAFLLSSELDPRDSARRPLRIDGRDPGTAGYPYLAPVP